MNDAPVLDEATVEVLRDIKEDEFPLLVRAYIDEAIKLIDDMRRAVNDGDHPALQRAAHSLKSSSANIGAARLADTARALEHKAREADASDAAALLKTANSLFDAVRPRLQSAATR